MAYTKDGQKVMTPARRDIAAGYGSYLVTKSDTVALDPPPRSLYVTGAGDVSFIGDDGVTDTWTVPANFIIPVRIKQVLAAGTTATGIHAIV